MFEVLVEYDQILQIPAHDLLCWLGEKVWREINSETSDRPVPIIMYEPSPIKEESTFLLLGNSGSVHRATSIEMALRQAALDELQAGNVFLREWTPRRSRQAPNGRREQALRA